MELTSVAQCDTDAGRRAFRIGRGQIRGRPELDAGEQLLDIASPDTFGLRLFGPDLPVEKSYGAQVSQVVVGLFLGQGVVFVAVPVAASEVVCALEDLERHVGDVIAGEVLWLFVIQSALTSEWSAPLCRSDRQR